MSSVIDFVPPVPSHTLFLQVAGRLGLGRGAVRLDRSNRTSPEVPVALARGIRSGAVAHRGAARAAVGGAAGAARAGRPVLVVGPPPLPASRSLLLSTLATGSHAGGEGAEGQGKSAVSASLRARVIIDGPSGSGRAGGLSWTLDDIRTRGLRQGS